MRPLPLRPRIEKMLLHLAGTSGGVKLTIIFIFPKKPSNKNGEGTVLTQNQRSCNVVGTQFDKIKLWRSHKTMAPGG